jgi:hypothetical protein
MLIGCASHEPFRRKYGSEERWLKVSQKIPVDLEFSESSSTKSVPQSGSRKKTVENFAARVRIGGTEEARVC